MLCTGLWTSHRLARLHPLSLQPEAFPDVHARSFPVQQSFRASGLTLAVVAGCFSSAARRGSQRWPVDRTKRRKQRGMLVAAHSTIEAREAIRRCLRENRSSLVFQNLPEIALQQLLDSMTRVEAKQSQVLFSHGDTCESMFIVESGYLEITKNMVQESGGEDVVVKQRVSPGEYVGELALLFNRPRDVSVAVEHGQSAVLWSLERKDFVDVIQALADCDTRGECTVQDTMKTIFVVSDGSGESATSAVNMAAKQFDNVWLGSGGQNVVCFPFVRYAAEVFEITRRARSEQALIIYTLMRPGPRDAMHQEADRELLDGEAKLHAVDLWEPMLAEMEVLFGEKRRQEVKTSELRPTLSSTCLQMVEAIEYTQRMDDGVFPALWAECDVLLIGLSRAGKTPLSYFLAQRGYKVANYPVVPDEDPPSELFDPALQSRCIALTISPEPLKARRTARMKEFGRDRSTYGSLETCMKEVGWLKTFYMRRGPRWPVIDTSSGAVEEIAGKILKVLGNVSSKDMPSVI